MSTEGTNSIYALMPLVMADIGAIAKEQKNTYHDYKFRGIDDVLNAIHPSLAKHRVSLTVQSSRPQITERMVQSRQDRQQTQFDCRMSLRVTFWAPDGSHMTSTLAGHGLSNSDDKAIAKCQSSIYKQIMFLALAIPVDDQLNPDSDTYQVQPEGEEEKATPRSRTGRASNRASRPESRTTKEGGATQQKNFAEDSPHGGQKETASKLSKGQTAIANCHTVKDVDEILQRAAGYLRDKQITPEEYGILLTAGYVRQIALSHAIKEIEAVIAKAKTFFVNKEITKDQYGELAIASADRVQFLSASGATK